MRTPLVSFRVPADLEAALERAAPENVSGFIVETLRGRLIPKPGESEPEQPDARTLPTPQTDHGPALAAAALEYVSTLPLLIPAADAAKRLRSHLTMSEMGAAFDLGDGQQPIPLDAEVVRELLADVVQVQGSGGSGGRGAGEYRPPPKREPPPFRGLVHFVGGNVRVDVSAYSRMTREEQRRFHEESR